MKNGETKVTAPADMCGVSLGNPHKCLSTSSIHTRAWRTVSSRRRAQWLAHTATAAARIVTSQTAFVKIGDRACKDDRPGSVIEHVQMLASTAQDIVHGPLAQVNLERIGHRLFEPCVGKHLILVSIAHDAQNLALTALAGRLLGKDGFVAVLAQRADHELCAMFDHLDPGCRDIEQLACLETEYRRCVQLQPADRAGFRHTINELIRVSSLIERLPWKSQLAT